MARCVAHFTAPSLCPRRHVQPEEYNKPRRCVKMMSSSQVHVLRIQSFSGLMPSNALVDLTAWPAQDFLSKVNLSISSRKGRASRCVTKAMFERFTEKSIKVIMLAQEEARRLGHNFVGTEQILLGLIGEGTGIAAKVLKSMGINLKDSRVVVEKIIGRGSGYAAVEIPFTPRAKRVLESSLEEARQPGQNDFGPEHQTTLVLLGLLREGEGVAARAKRVMELSLDEPRLHGHNYIRSERILLRLLRKGEDAAALAKLVLELSLNGAGQLGQNEIGPEHLLLALLREEKGVAARVLKNLGADPSNIRRQVIRMVEENIEGK